MNALELQATIAGAGLPISDQHQTLGQKARFMISAVMQWLLGAGCEAACANE